MKQNLANSIIMPPKNGGLKAWSHSVRKANLLRQSYPTFSAPTFSFFNFERRDLKEQHIRMHSVHLTLEISRLVELLGQHI